MVDIIEQSQLKSCPKCNRTPRDAPADEMVRCTKCGHVYVANIVGSGEFVLTPEIDAKYRSRAENKRPPKSIPEDTEVFVTACDSCKKVFRISVMLEESHGMRARQKEKLEQTECHICREGTKIVVAQGQLHSVRANMKARGFRWLG